MGRKPGLAAQLAAIKGYVNGRGVKYTHVLLVYDKESNQMALWSDTSKIEAGYLMSQAVIQIADDVEKEEQVNSSGGTS
jgi:hypothetical protein